MARGCVHHDQHAHYGGVDIYPLARCPSFSFTISHHLSGLALRLRLPRVDQQKHFQNPFHFPRFFLQLTDFKAVAQASMCHNLGYTFIMF